MIKNVYPAALRISDGDSLEIKFESPRARIWTVDGLSAFHFSSDIDMVYVLTQSNYRDAMRWNLIYRARNYLMRRCRRIRPAV